jgi:two-component system sensor histidine kinase BarA
MASVLASSSELRETQREHLTVIMDSGNDLLTLISDILDQARLDSRSVILDPGPFALRDLLDDIIYSMAPVAQNKGLEIGLLNSLEDDPPILITDGFRVKQVYSLLSS